MNSVQNSVKQSVLYVDDESQNLTSFRAAFRRQFKVYTAQSGQEGLEILKHNEIAVIITDQRMPEMTGVQFLEKVIPDFPDTVRMILTGFSDVEAIIRAINTGRVFRYVTKPWDENELRMTIDNACHFYDLQQRNKKLLNELQQKITEQEKTLRLFRKYVPVEVVDKALSASEDSIFEGETREVSVIFCDIRGFTAFSERFAPREVVACLNYYYSLMTDCVKRHNGLVNQFVGDEVFASFGALVPNLNNEYNAVSCALDMIGKVKDFNEEITRIVGQDAHLNIGVGINSGVVVAGNLGSEDRIEFSITGDTVNTGKRIETLTRDHPNTILISDSVYHKVKDKIAVSPWDPVQVKGKAELLQVYELKNLL